MYTGKNKNIQIDPLVKINVIKMTYLILAVFGGKNKNIPVKINADKLAY